MAVSQIPPRQEEQIFPPTSNFSFVIPDNTKRYFYDEVITPGSYTLTCPSANVVTIYLHSTDLAQNTTEVKYTTSSGTVTFLLDRQYDAITATLNTGTNISCTMTRNSSYELYRASVLDSITTTSTYTQKGSGLVLVLGAGQGGFYSSGASRSGGPGGASGKAVVKYMELTGSIPVVVGSGGTLGASNTVPAGNSGGDSSFGNLTASGGSPSNIGSSGGSGGNVNNSNSYGNSGGGGGSNGSPGSGFSVNQYGIISSNLIFGGSGGAGGSFQLYFGGWWGGGQGGPGGIYGGGGGGGSGGNGAGAGHGGGGGGGVNASTTSGGAGAVYVLRFPES